MTARRAQAFEVAMAQIDRAFELARTLPPVPAADMAQDAIASAKRDLAFARSMQGLGWRRSAERAAALQRAAHFRRVAAGWLAKARAESLKAAA